MKNVRNIAVITTLIIIITVVIFMQSPETTGLSHEKSSPSEGTGRKPLPSPEELKKLPPDGGPHYNRLVFEKSPYLLQHAGNPVDWYPWGDEAFETARREDKPIFLSIGYSTCHWCHVMEHESFEDEEVAALMNEAFVCIKVDREERPDIDQIYMAVCQAMTGSGGWPMTIVMTPDKQPFFAGTYFPKQSRFQRIGMMELVPQLSEVWKSEREKVHESTEQVMAFLKQTVEIQPGAEISKTILNTAYHQLSSRYDEKYGGFGQAPKFPSPHNFTFLLRYWHRTGDKHALAMVEHTLQQMRLGGIFDQVGFGFHRYSTDAHWLLPHFEKMLYDQAMLAMAYVETFQATGKEVYAQTAKEILTYVLRDMTSPEGGFYSAEDADSEGEEGLFYLWTPEELQELLGEEHGELVIRLFNVEEGGNFLDQATQQKTGGSILHLKKSLVEHAKELDRSPEDLTQAWEEARKKLFDTRKKRIHPLKDDKILTDWNGLMIAAFAKGATALGEPRYAQAAGKAADFILKELRDAEGRLLKRFRQGEAGLPAHVDDYAFFVWGLLETYEATLQVRYLEHAIELNDIMLDNFWDESHGGLFFSADSLEDLLIRTKEIYDGATPSGNSVAALNLIRLGRISGRTDLEEKATGIARAFATQIQRAPSGNTQLMSALNFAFGPSYEVVIAGHQDGKDTNEMLAALQKNYFPNKVVIFRPEDEEDTRITQIASFTQLQRSLNGKATAYVCKNYACNAPTNDIQAMLDALGSTANN